MRDTLLQCCAAVVLSCALLESCCGPASAARAWVSNANSTPVLSAVTRMSWLGHLWAYSSGLGLELHWGARCGG